MRSLLAITEDLDKILDALAEREGGAPDPEIPTAVDAWFLALKEELADSVDNYCAMIRELEERSKGRKAEADRLAKRARVDANSADWLKATLLAVLQSRGLRKLETNRYRVSIAANGGKLPLDLPDPSRVPEQWLEYPPPVPDTKAIRAALEAGTALPFAALRERGTHLSIQ